MTADPEPDALSSSGTLNGIFFNQGPLTTTNQPRTNLSASLESPAITWPQAFVEVSGYICITIFLVFALKHIFKLISLGFP